ncbi:MAG: DUF547 domain-containing protein [Spirosoma sp.]|nr:DUF547 domain-containing protein [Spirosoma sp.]
MKTLILIVFGLLLTPALQAQTSLASLNKEADSFLQAHVYDGRVDYATLKKDPAAINKLYGQIGAMNLSGASAGEKKAFYINAYNLAVIHQVVEAYPIKSPMDVPGFFDKKQQKIAGESLTLNELEKEKLLKPYNDARVHFAVVCAAKGCPVIDNNAFTAQNLDAQLDARAKLALNSSYFIRVNSGKKSVDVSKIFEWYADDFTKGGKSILAYINGFRQQDIPGNYKVGTYDYDWSLNVR